jgi:hypothetical protein
MRVLNFTVNLSHEEMLAIYNGAIKKVMVHSDTGLRIELNAYHFKAFTTMNGVRGRFKMVLDDNNKMLSLEKIA